LSSALFAALTGLLAIGCPSPARAFQQQLRADMVASGGSVPAPMSGAIYVSGNNVRLEMAMGGTSIALLAETSSRAFTLLVPNELMYMPISVEMVPGAAPPVVGLDAANPCATDGVTNCVSLGPEQVNGYETAGWQYDANGVSMTAWISTEFQFPVRIISTDGMITDFTNIEEGPQDPSLFEIPPDYQPMPGFGAGPG
jgi:hypothetical protein